MPVGIVLTLTITCGCLRSLAIPFSVLLSNPRRLRTVPGLRARCPGNWSVPTGPQESLELQVVQHTPLPFSVCVNVERVPFDVYELQHEHCDERSDDPDQDAEIRAIEMVEDDGDCGGSPDETEDRNDPV